MMCPDCKIKMAVKDTIAEHQVSTYDRRQVLKNWAEKTLGPYKHRDWIARRHKCPSCKGSGRSIEFPSNLAVELIANSISPQERTDVPKIYKVRPYLK